MSRAYLGRGAGRGLLLGIVRGLLLAPLFLLGACGFHLRGSEPLPQVLNDVHLQAASPGDEPLVRLLRERLSLYAKRAQARPDAPVLIIQGTNIEQRVASIDPQGVAREFLLILHTHYRLQGADGRELIPDQYLEVQRDYSYITGNALAIDQQMRALQDELLHTGAERILRSLSLYQARK